MRFEQGNWRGCAFYFGDHLLETQQIVALSTAESEYISITKGAAHALEVRSAMVEGGLTLKEVTLCRPRASLGCAVFMAAVACRMRGGSASQAWRTQPGRPGNKDGRFEANDLAVERNTPSATNGLELMDGGDHSPRGCRGSKRLPCTTLEREEHVQDEWLVLDLRGNGHCDPDGAVRWTVCESRF